MNYPITFVLEKVAGEGGEKGPDVSMPPCDQRRLFAYLIGVSSRKGGDESMGLQARYRKIRRARRHAVVLHL